MRRFCQRTTAETPYRPRSDAISAENAAFWTYFVY
jgi:hypothetical protein